MISVDNEKVGTLEEARILLVEESAGHHNPGPGLASFLVDHDSGMTIVGEFENILVHRPILLAFCLQYYE